jgi:Tat protein translocase TatB subunit
MLEIGWGKLVLIGIVALLVIGPKELPAVLRTMGQWMTKLRRMAAEFQSQFQEAMREAELADLKKQVDKMSSTAQSYTNFDPLSDVRREFETTQHQIESAMTAPVPAKRGRGQNVEYSCQRDQPPLASSETHSRCDWHRDGHDWRRNRAGPKRSRRSRRQARVTQEDIDASKAPLLDH